MIILSIALGIVFAAAAFYWIVSTVIDVVIAFIRGFGYSSTSAVPGIATITGLVAVAIAREYFGWIDSPIFYLVAIFPDICLQLGELILVVRVKVLHFPDKAARSAAEPDAT